MYVRLLQSYVRECDILFVVVVVIFVIVDDVNDAIFD